MNTYKAARLRFLPILSRYSRMSETVQHDEQCSSLHNRWRFRHDEQRSSLHAEGLKDHGAVLQKIPLAVCVHEIWHSASALM